MKKLFVFLLLTIVFLGAVEDRLVLSGEPAESGFIINAVQSYLLREYPRNYAREISGSKNIFLNPEGIKALEAGQWQEITVSHNVSKMAEPFFKLTTINIYNQPVELNDCDYLLVSNEPEEILKSGLLFDFDLEAKKSVRIVIYHKNSSEKLLSLDIFLNNREFTTGKVHVLNGVGGSSSDGLFAGHVAVKSFFSAWSSKQGCYVDLEPNFSKNIFSQWIKPQEIVSAVYEIRNQSAQLVNIQLVAQNENDRGIAKYFSVNKEKNKNRIGGIFVAPQKELFQKIDLNNKIVSFRIGDEPFIVDNKTGRQLRGNYGLIYKYNLQLTNHSENDKIIELYIVPNGGVARASFLVDGQVKDSELAIPSRKSSIVKFAEITVPAKYIKQTVLTTMPQPGSNYPVTLLLTAR